jgi:hypothetical protein
MERDWFDAFAHVSVDPLIIVVSATAALAGLRFGRPPLAVALAAVVAGTLSLIVAPLWLAALRAAAEVMWSISILFLLGGFGAGSDRGRKGR